MAIGFPFYISDIWSLMMAVSYSRNM